jgi:hypothetical protein
MGFNNRKEKMQEPKFNMNDVLKDTISGFKGQVQGITFYATGCIHYGLVSTQTKPDGTLMDWVWLDETRLILVKSAQAKRVSKSRSGPDMNPRSY